MKRHIFMAVSLLLLLGYPTLYADDKKIAPAKDDFTKPSLIKTKHFRINLDRSYKLFSKHDQSDKKDEDLEYHIVHDAEQRIVMSIKVNLVPVEYGFGPLKPSQNKGSSSLEMYVRRFDKFLSHVLIGKKAKQFVYMLVVSGNLGKLSKEKHYELLKSMSFLNPDNGTYVRLKLPKSKTVK